MLPLSPSLDQLLNFENFQLKLSEDAHLLARLIEFEGLHVAIFSSTCLGPLADLENVSLFASCPDGQTLLEGEQLRFFEGLSIVRAVPRTAEGAT